MTGAPTDSPGRPTTRASWVAIGIILLPVVIGTPIAASGRFELALLFVPLAVLIAYLLRHRVPGIWPGEDLARRKLDRRSVIKGIVAGPVVVIVMSVIGGVLARTLGWQPDASAFTAIEGNTLVLLAFLVIAWTSAAFGEEIVFRGVVMENLAGILARGGMVAGRARVSGLILSSSLFGLAHAYQGGAGIVNTGLAGFLYGTLYLLSPANLWPSVIAHGVTDTIGIVALYLGGGPG